MSLEYEREGMYVYLKVRAGRLYLICVNVHNYFANGCQNAGALVVEVESMY